ncbi:DUF6125 family protein [Chloroflexota bacterium]
MMKELIDYSGEFDPSIKYDDFSKGFLLKLLNAYSEYLLRVDGFWYLTVKERMSDEEAFTCDRKVWEKLQIYELETTCKLFKIQGNDVATMMKGMQMSPWMWIYKYDIELKSPNHGLLTITHCPTLLALEKEGQGREKNICQMLEPDLFKLIADFFNPKIEVQALKIPPRKSKDEICCQWDFSLK